MTLDAYTVNVLVAVVTFVAGIIFILDTLLRREVGAGRIWALGFLCGMLTMVCYVIWQAVPDPWAAIAVGNGALIGTLGCLWLGAVRYNDRSIAIRSVVVGVVAVVEVALVLAIGPSGGDWAGAAFLFFGVGGFAVLGAIETRRGRLGSSLTSLSFTVMLAIVAVFYGARAVVFFVDGEDGELFTTWFGSSVTGVLTVMLIIIAVVAATTLRTGQTAQRFEVQRTELHLTADGLLTEPAFQAILQCTLDRARTQPGQAAPASFAVVAFRIDDLAGVRAAFGESAVDRLVSASRQAARTHAPATALIGEGGSDAILVAFESTSVGDTRRTASRIQRGMLDDIVHGGSVVLPPLGVGVALTDPLGADADRLVAGALAAAKHSSISAEASVMIAGE